MWVLKALWCTITGHDYKFQDNIHGEEIIWRNGKRSKWWCRKCGLVSYGDYLHQPATKENTHMSNEIKAALHVAMEAIDAKLRHTGLKPGHENDLRAAKGVLRSMISNLPAASGQQDLRGVLLEVDEILCSAMLPKTSQSTMRMRVKSAIVEIRSAISAHPAPAQPSGIESAIYRAIKTGTGCYKFEAIDPADVFHPAPAQQESAPAQAALTDERRTKIQEAIAALDSPYFGDYKPCKGQMEAAYELVNVAREFLELYATSAAPAELDVRRT